MELNLKEKYLPIGTVVLLKDGKKRLMVTGFCVVSPENRNKVFDYCGCVFPEGYISSKQNCLFDHNQIDKIFHIGLYDENAVQFRTKLVDYEPKMIENLKKKNDMSSDNVGDTNASAIDLMENIDK